MPPWMGPGRTMATSIDQVVELARREPRQHGHLRARLHLEHADGVGARNHLVDARVFARDVGQPERLAAEARHQLEAAAQRRQHAEAQHVHLEQAQVIEIVLVPFDDGAVFHGRVFDGHEFLEQALRDHEAAARAATGAAEIPAARTASCSSSLSCGLAGLEAGLADAVSHPPRYPTIASRPREPLGLHGVEPHAPWPCRAARCAGDNR